jgi:hypothetical protein
MQSHTSQIRGDYSLATACYMEHLKEYTMILYIPSQDKKYNISFKGTARQMLNFQRQLRQKACVYFIYSNDLFKAG